MSAFTKRDAKQFCRKCYKNDDNQCVRHEKETVNGVDRYVTYGCEHRGLTAAKLYCNVCGNAPKKWNEDKKEWVSFEAVTTRMNNVDKRPPTKKDTKSKRNKKFKFPKNAVNCSQYHSDMMGCIKHSECNYCEMPSDGIKDMKCLSDNMKGKLEMADVIDAYSCINKNAFNSNKIDTIDKNGVNSTDYTRYYGFTVPDYTNMNTTSDETNNNNTMNGAGDTSPSFSTYTEYNEPTFNEIKQANEPEEKVVGENEERKKKNETSTTNNNDQDQFFFLGENPTVSESVKYHYDEGYFFDSYTGHGLEFNNNNEMQEYDDNVLKENENKGVESEKEEEEEEEQTITNPSNIVEIGENNVVSNTEKKEETTENKDKKTSLNHIKSIVSLQNVVRDMDNTSRMLSYGLVTIFVIMILLFVILTLKK